MMPDFARRCRRLSAALALALLAAAGTAVAAQAEYGEIARFGAAGIGEGQFQTLEGGSLGVNPTNNDVYVVDLPNEKPFKLDEFRIQRFDPNSKGEYGKPVATVTFKPQDDELKEEEVDEITNVAVDPKNNRIYVLASEERPSEDQFDAGDDAATELWAFNIEGEGLTSLGAIAGSKVFKPLGKVQGEALLEPAGIAVDPTNGDVIVLGEEGKGEREGIDALERITPAGALAEKRWSDPLGPEAPEGLVLEDEATSPVVTKNGEILVLHGDEIDEVDKIPATLSAEQAPTPVYQANPEVNEEPALVDEELTAFPGTADQEPTGGGGASLGEEGRLYASAAITEQDPELRKGKLTGPLAPGVLEFSSTGGLEKEWADEGWTGGQSVASVGAKGPCKISVNVQSKVAAGTERHVFVFDENPESPSVIEFGPGGTGCPKGRVAAPTASTLSSGGKPIAETEPIPIADKVTLSSSLVESNALSVEWEFGDGTKTSVNAGQHQTTSVEHTFVKAGKLEITERIHTDDLAEPELVTHSKIDIAGTQPAVVPTPASLVTGTSATLNATVNPEGTKVESCKFEYGTSLPSGKFAECTPAAAALGEGKSPVAVAAAIVGLSPETTYQVKVTATNSGGTGEATTTFKTAGKPVVVASAVSVVTQTSATLHATVNPDGAEVTTCTFEYGTSSTAMKTAPCSPAPGKGQSPVAVSAALTGLSANTKYEVRVIVTNENGTSEATTAFKTAEESSPPPPPPPPPPPTDEHPGGGGVLGAKALAPALAGTSPVSSSGAFTLTLKCPAGSSSCTGTITLKTAKAVIASVGRAARKKRAILTLATGSFTLSAGQTKTVTLHLSSLGRTLLAHSHVLSAVATLIAHGSSATETATAKAGVTLRLKVTKKR